MSGAQGFNVGDPAPDRGKVPGWQVLIALGGAAALWLGQLFYTTAVAGMVCLDETGAAEGVAPDWADASLALVNLAALALSVLALLLGIRNLRRTGREEEVGSHGVMDAGEGRTRFLSVWSIWGSVLFIVAIAFNTGAVLWRGMCPF